MMRRPVIAATLLPLMLAACGSEEPAASGEGLSTDEVIERAKAAGADIKPEPGLYRSSVEIQEVSIPGAPAQMRDMMRSAMATQSDEYCLTAEDADKGFEEMARQSQDNMDCTFERFDVDGGDIDARMTCSPQGQGTMTVEVTGTGTSTSSEMNMAMTGEMPGMGEMSVKMRTTNERIGDCPA